MPYLYKRSITIQSSRVAGGPHTDFPVLVSLTNNDLRVVGSGGHVQNSDGHDIGFFADENLTSALYWDLDEYDPTTGRLLVHVRVPSISSSANVIIYMAYGDASISTYQSSRPDTWYNYRHVLHMKESSATLLNSTGSASGSKLGATEPAVNTSGKLGSCQAFDGTNDEFTIADTANLTAWSVSFWFYPATAYSNRGYWGWGLNDGTGDALQYRAHFGGFSLFAQAYDTAYRTVAGSVLPLNVWYHIAICGSNSGTLKYFVNGVSTGTPPAIGTLQTGRQRWRFGVVTGLTPFKGRLDEIRVAPVEHGANWWLTEYANHNAPGTFHTIGSEESHVSPSRRRIIII